MGRVLIRNFSDKRQINDGLDMARGNRCSQCKLSTGEVHNVHWISLDGKGGRAPQPFTFFDSLKPEDLWNYLESYRVRGIDVLAIPHHSNISNGLTFNGLDSNGKPIDSAYPERRAVSELAVEISNNGQSETLPQLSPEDRFADFEMFGNANFVDVRGGYVRHGLGRGLEIGGRTGVALRDRHVKRPELG